MEIEKTRVSNEHLEKIKKWLGSGAINIFGLPFAGKDTHGHKLAELFNAHLLSSGEVFRSSKSLLSAEDQQVLDTGGLPPSDVFLRLFTPYFAKSEYDGKPLILSSVGRWLGEEQAILEAAETSGHPIKAVIYLHLSEENVRKRLQASQEIGDRTRPEDSEQFLDTRIDEFNTKTLPVIEVYRKMGLLIEVNSDAEKSEVLETILARLFMVASSNET
jgi:adenylate kinase